MKKFNIFSILRPGKLFLLTLAAWLTMSPSRAQEYLGFTATEAGTTTVKLNKEGSPNNVSLQYRINEASTWTDYSVGNSISLSQGSKVEFKAKTTNSKFSKNFGYHNAETNWSYTKEDTDYLTGDFYYFSFSNKVEASGNVSTLLNSTGTVSTLPSYAFVGLFQNCANLVSAPSLPDKNVTLGDYCYAGMFYQCTSLRSAPELPAETLKYRCYAYMFAGCEKLQSIKVGFTSWQNSTNATYNWAYTTRQYKRSAIFVSENDYHAFSATGGTFYKESSLSFETGVSRIPTGWVIPTSEDYLFFTWNSTIATTSALEAAWYAIIGKELDISVTIKLNFPSSLAQSNVNNNKFFEARVLEYSKSGDPSDWHVWDYRNGETIKLKYGESCFIRSKDSKGLFSESASRYLYFTITPSSDAKNKLNDFISGNNGIISVTGNIMSLIDKKCLKNEVPEYGFYKLFSGVDCIFNAPSLPATDLNPHCYESMFEGCNKLNSAPNLPATSEQIEEAEAIDCYKNMFNGCTMLEYIKVGFDKWFFDKLSTTNGTFEITNNWVNGVTTTGGTFRCPDGLSQEFNNSRIPTTWATSSNVGAVDENKDWLCFEVADQLGTIKLNRSNASLTNLTDKLQYSFTGADGSWQNYTWADKMGKLIELDGKEGPHRVYFKSTVTDNSGRCSTSGSLYYQFVITGKLVASGNIMSLLREDCDRYDVNDFEFYNMFNGCTTLESAPSLPATSLGISCYQQMFTGCSSLIYAPELPATELKRSCYNVMFARCTKLSSAPDLPATILAETCYHRMFDGCTSLESAPLLPAKDLVTGCYMKMFNGCSALNYINVNFLDWEVTNATTDWVNGVSDNGTFFCPSTIAENPAFGANRIPKENIDGKRWVVKENSNIALYFEAKRNSSTVQLNKVGTPYDISLLYSDDDGQSWNDYTWSGTTGKTITLNRVGNNRVYFKAGKTNDDTYVTNTKFSKDASNYYQFVTKGSFNVKGNAMYLLSKDASLETVPDYAFTYLFYNCRTIHTAPSLPAKQIGEQSYAYMFLDCTSLETAPELPAEKMKYRSYICMFSRCTNLKQAPELPAKELANQCYLRMFDECASLTAAPELPATELKESCYAYMFRGCSSIQYINVGFSSWPTNNATTDWFADYKGKTIPSTGIFMCPEELPHDKNANPSNFGASRIPKADVDGQRWNVNVVALRFTANNNATIALEKIGTPDNINMEYSIDNAISWHPYVFGDVVTLKTGKTFYIRATDDFGKFSKDASNYYKFNTVGNLSVDGNIMALMDNLARGTEVPNYAFYNLFSGCEGLANVPELPASTVGDHGYANMFSGCLGFTEVNALRASSLGKSCYSGMFSDCINLKTAPALPIEELNDYCYAEMFKGCSGLKEAPKLPATALNTGCYQAMFQNCTSLQFAPELPATALVKNCYNNMFNGCSSLCEISVEFSAWNPSDATTGWVSGVANQGIFSCPKELDVSTFSANRVPKNGTYPWEVNPDFLGFKATTDATIALNKVGIPHAAYLIYSVNSKSKWKSYSWDGQNGLTIELHAGESVYFKAENDYNAVETTNENNPVPNKLSKDADNYYQFSITGTVAASGKASFLLSRTKNSEEVPAYGFYRLFKDCTGLTTAPGVAICAKANAHSYESMFEGCNNMTTSPETLPATTLAESCYKNMYKGCEKMATSPAALPATSVVESCYESMFEGDSLITRIPTLGVSTNTAKAAYKNMFKGCKSMTSDNMPSQLTAASYTALSESVYESMFEGCSSITNANINLLSKGLAVSCYKNMFKGCTNLTATMASLPTPYNLTESCYEGMFEGCESITTAPDVAWTNNPGIATFKAMFKGCKALVNNLPSSLASGNVSQESCYESLFEGCESMNSKIDLPSRGLKKAVYKAMFKDCKSLTSDNLPELGFDNWAIANGESALESMFEGCESLTTPVVIRDVANWSQYPKAIMRKMFKGCTNLTTPLTLPLASIGEACFESMFEGCESLTKAPQLPQTNLAKDCYKRMFMDCTSLKRAPQLPAKTGQLQDSCYAYMFNGCTSLRYIDVAFNTWFDEQGANFDGATYMWVENVAPTGTFMCPFELDKTKVDASHIPSGWSADDNGNYLYIAKVGGGDFDVYLNKQGNPNDINYQFSLDKKTWTSFSTDIWNNNKILSGNNTIVYIKCAEGVMSKDANNYWYFSTSGNVKIGGNITSLLDASMEQTDVPDYAFYKLFSECHNVSDISELELPATEVGAYAYANMFEGCNTLKSSATSTPELPATTIGAYCYQNLFQGWTALTKAPELPATTLAEGCYSGLFKGCTSLTTAPVLPATTLVNDCYDSLFDGCTSLSSINVAFTEWVEGATDNWVNGVVDKGDFECPWDLAQSAKTNWVTPANGYDYGNAYGGSKIPKDSPVKQRWIILTHTDMEFDYKTGKLTIAGGNSIYWSTDESLAIDNYATVGTLADAAPAIVDCNEWLNATTNDLDSITYYALALPDDVDGFTKPTVNSLTIYRYPKKIDMCICDNETRLKKALYYANKVSSPRYPIKLFIPDGTYNLDETLVVSDSTISLIGESLNGTILKSSAPNGVFKITGDNVYMQDMKLVNTASGAAFTNRSLNTTMRVAIDGYYIEAPGGVESKRYALPEATWNRATDPTQATIASVSQNGSTLCVTPGENNTSKYLVRVDNKYSFASTKDFFILESLEGKNVYVRAANARGAFGEPVSPDKLEANGSEYTELTIKLNGNGFSSFSFDDPLVDQLKVIGASVYKGVYHEGAVYLTRLNEHDIVPRGTGVILAGLPNATLQLYYDNAIVDHDPYKDVTGDNIPLYGNCNEAIQRKPGDGKYYYGLSGNVFKKLSETGSVKPNKAFFDLTGKVDANASSIRIIFGMWEEEEEEVVSGINYLPTAGNDSEYSYMLTGVRMKDAKGLVIQNNKVVLIK